MTAQIMGNKVGGLILVALGAAFLANNLGWFSIQQLWKWWPVLLIAFGLSLLFQRR